MKRIRPNSFDGRAENPSAAAEFSLVSRDIALGLRFLALAVIAGLGSVLPVESTSRLLLTGGILAGAGLGILQWKLAHVVPRLAWFLIPAHVAVWTFLVHCTGGARSPVFVGYLLELPLAGIAASTPGCILASVSSVVASLARGALLDRPVDLAAAFTVTGSIVIGTILTLILIRVFETQHRIMMGYQHALTARAETLEQQLDLLGEYLTGALITLDANGTLCGLNPAAARLLAIEPQRALRRAWQESVRLDRESRVRLMEAITEGTNHHGIRMLLEHENGRVVAANGEIWSSPHPEGRRVHILMEAIPDDLGADPLHRLGESVAYVAHQIRNSLHVLIGETHDHSQAGTSRHRQTLGSLSQLAENVLAMAGGRHPRTEDIRVSDLLSAARMLLPDAGIELQMRGEGLECLVRGNRGELLHALFNVMDNACRVSPPATTVIVRAHAGDPVAIEISDSGPGMNVVANGLPEHSNSGNGCSANGSRSGSGFGIPAAARFLEANGGGLRFSARPEGGTTCRIEIPSVPEHDEAMNREPCES